MKAEKFFKQNEKDRIEKTIREVEASTAGELAVMVVERSDSYPEGRILAGILAGSLAAFIVSDIFFADSIWFFVPLALVLATLSGWLINYLPELNRLFISGIRQEEQVKDKALAAFYEKGLYRTRDKTGVLFFISLFEHKIWVLADQGIYEKISPDTLQAYVKDVARGIKTGTAADALCRAIRNIGVILTENFPIKPDDTNELSNKVIIG